MADRLDDRQLGNPARQQPQRPVGIALGGRPQTQGDDASLTGAAAAAARPHGRVDEQAFERMVEIPVVVEVLVVPDDLIAEELARVLERPVKLAIGQSAGVADVAARARSVKGLTDAGMPLADALKRVGWGDA